MRVKTKGRVNMTTHFYEDEFDCPCGCETTGERMDRNFVMDLQYLRNRLDIKIKVLVGMVCPRENARLGYKPHSYHMYGQAAKLQCEDGEYMMNVIRLADDLSLSVGVGRDCTIELDARKTTQIAWGY